MIVLFLGGWDLTVDTSYLRVTPSVDLPGLVATTCGIVSK